MLEQNGRVRREQKPFTDYYYSLLGERKEGWKPNCKCSVREKNLEVSDLIKKKNGKRATEMNRARENDKERRGGHERYTEKLTKLVKV